MRKYVRAGNVTWLGLDLSDVKEMDFTPKEFEVFALQPGDLLVVEGSGSATEVGKTALWRGELAECCFQNTLIRVRADEELTPYLLAHLRKEAITGSFARSSRGIGIHHIGAKALHDWKTVLPPLPEQRRIVAKIEALQARSRAAREALEAIVPLLDRFRQSVLAAAFRGDLTADWRANNPDVEPASVLLERIRIERRRRWEEEQLAKMKAKGKTPTDEKWKAKYKEPEPVDTEGLPGLPEGWCWASLGELAGLASNAMTDGPFGSKLKSAHYVEAGVRVIRLGNIGVGTFKNRNQSYIAPEHFETLRKHEVSPGDLLIAALAEPVGRCCEVPPGLGRAIVKAECVNGDETAVRRIL